MLQEMDERLREEERDKTKTANFIYLDCVNLIRKLI